MQNFFPISIDNFAVLSTIICVLKISPQTICPRKVWGHRKRGVPSVEFHKLPEELTLFHDVHRAHHNAMLAALAAQGLQDLGQPRVLFVLDGLKDGGATQRELAESVHVSPATMTASLKSLERQGYVTKHSDDADGRCKRVFLTQKGRDAVSRCKAAFDHVDKHLYAGFEPEEVERLKQDYRHMLANLYAIGGDRSPECPDCPDPHPL